MSLAADHQDSSDGAFPQSGLTKVGDTFFGTTTRGGVNSVGTIFSITAGGTESVIHAFAGGSDGAYPNAGVTNIDGTLYGTTYGGGAAGDGTVYQTSTAGSESVVHAFVGTDGAQPYNALVVDKGVLYGTTSIGGSANVGTIFSMSLTGGENLLYSFPGGTGGANPESPLLRLGRSFYGMTVSGGGSQSKGQRECSQELECGTLFRVTPNGGVRVLHYFGRGDDGYSPVSNVVVLGGNIYGATRFGGATGNGAIVQITPR